jgi:transposase
VLRGTLVFEDESGFSLACPLKRTWAPRGQTPKVRTSLQHNQRINVIGALLITPAGRRIKLRAKRHEVNLTGEQIIDFLKHLLRRVRSPILLIWDRAPIHQRKTVQEMIRRHKRLYVYNFPTSAPELNPVEFVWTQADEYLAGTAPENIGQLRANVQAALQRTRVSQKRLWACLHASDLPWQRGRMRH